MNKIIKSNDFAGAVSGMIQEFVAEQEAELLKIVKNEAEHTVETLKRNSPKRSGDYKDGWTLKKTGRYANGNKMFSNGGVIFTIYNKDHYRLTHLLEKGAIRAKKGILDPIPHITPAFEQARKNIDKKTGGN